MKDIIETIVCWAIIAGIFAGGYCVGREAGYNQGENNAMRERLNTEVREF